MVNVSTRVLDALKTIGLNLYERRIWVALLSKGTATVGELAELANVPRSRAYDILESLERKGFVMLQPSKPLKAVAIPPEEALERAKKNLEEEFKKSIERIDRMKTSDIVKELKKIYEKGVKVIQPEEMTSALKGKYSVFQQLDYMFRNATKRINIVTTPEGLEEIAKHHLPSLKRASERGVDIKIATVGEPKKINIKGLNEIADVRVVSSKDVPIYGRFAIVDGSELVMHLMDTRKVDPSQDMAIWTKSQHASSNILEPVFSLIWKFSKPL